MLTQHVVDCSEVPQGRGMRRRSAGYLLQEHYCLLLPCLLATQRGHVLEALHVPGEPAFHAERLDGHVEGVSLVQRIILDVGAGQVKAGSQHFGIPKPSRGRCDAFGILGLEAPKYLQVAFGSAHEVVLLPHEVGLFQRRFLRRPQYRVLRWRQKGPEGYHERLELGPVPRCHAEGQCGASYISGPRVVAPTIVSASRSGVLGCTACALARWHCSTYPSAGLTHTPTDQRKHGLLLLPLAQRPVHSSADGSLTPQGTRSEQRRR
mmetsp:Transcript_37711/g.82850  ORF Transcript_37711/g.82850 Transcript_37711/m.82850 type:complete len:264 (+) Transcript_37711:965-1756(+)